MRGSADKSADKTPRSEIREYRRILKRIDYEQHLNLSAHLYSAFLLKKISSIRETGEKDTHQVPRPWWTSWPKINAPEPPYIADTYPVDPNPIVSERAVEKIQNDYIRRTRIGTKIPTTGNIAFLRACEEVYQRKIYQRIFEDKRFDLEPVADPEPTLNNGSERLLLEAVDKYATVPFKNKQDVVLLNWKHLEIQGPAKERLERLFEKDYKSYIDSASATIERDDYDSQSESEN